MFKNILSVYFCLIKEIYQVRAQWHLVLRPNIFPIIFGFSPHSPKKAAALQALNLHPREKEEEGEHEPQLPSFNRKTEVFLLHLPAPPPPANVQSHLSSCQEFSANGIRMQERRGLERVTDSAKQQCVPSPKC